MAEESELGVEESCCWGECWERLDEPRRPDVLPPIRPADEAACPNTDRFGADVIRQSRPFGASCAEEELRAEEGGEEGDEDTAAAKSRARMVMFNPNSVLLCFDLLRASVFHERKLL